MPLITDSKPMSQSLNSDPLTKRYPIIDADAHVMEPHNIWLDYLEPQFRDRVGKELALDTQEGILYYRDEPIAEGLSQRLMEEGRKNSLAHYPRAMQERFSSDSHAHDLKEIGFSRVFLYPTIGLWMFYIDSMPADLAGALVRAYNNWLREFCARNPKILYGVGAINMHDPAEMVAEVERVANFGWRAVFIRPNPVKGRTLAHPDYEPFWTACEQRGLAISIHEGTHARVPTLAGDRFQSRFSRHACSHPMEMMAAMLALMESGVMERHPELRFAFLEAGAGWLPYWLFRLDEEFAQLPWEVEGRICRKPSEYFRRQCYIGCEPGEPYLGELIPFIGKDNILFGSDYPHVDHSAESLKELLENNSHMGPEIMKKILLDNPAAFYGLTD